MYSTYWQIIKDDSKMTFEICGKSENCNSFTNNTHGMQKAGMNVSCSTPPVTNKTANKSVIKIFGYTKEDGLHQRLLKQYQELTRKSADEWSE